MSDSQKSPLGWPQPQGLWHPSHEKDSCGVGFIAHLKGKRSHDIIEKTLTMNTNMDHRGASGAEPETGDGAGIFVQMPDKFLRRVMVEHEVDLPPEGQYGAGIVFLSPHSGEREAAMQLFEHIIKEEGQRFLGWRNVPVKSSILGKTSGRYEPLMKQIFIGRNPELTHILDFERVLYIIRKRMVNAVRTNEVPVQFYDVHRNERNSFPGSEYFYINGLSARTMIYKGMLTPCQLEEYFPDLHDPDFESALALMHTRFSTNTFPSWPRAHPNRMIAHNGEINTVMGNVNFMKSRQALCRSARFGDNIRKIFPVINEDGSDSARFDNVLEFLHMGGYDLTHAMMMMIPEPWERHENMDPAKRAFYEFHACMMEPWDGPASITFSDGYQIGAVLDRNGLRPSRYYVTDDDLVIMASEVGVLPNLDPLSVVEKGRLQPGRMFLVDMNEGRIIPDQELKERVYSAHPYQKWLDANRIKVDDLPEPENVPGVTPDTIRTRQLAFGYTYEDLRFLLGPSAQSGVQPIGSMGNDTPLAILSDRPKHLYQYFKQIFAQVTNPALDCIREELVTATETFIGSEGNLLNPGPKSCRMIRMDTPIIDNRTLAKLREVKRDGFKSATVDALFPADQDGKGLEKALTNLFRRHRLAKGRSQHRHPDRPEPRPGQRGHAHPSRHGRAPYLVKKAPGPGCPSSSDRRGPRSITLPSCWATADAINPYMAFESLHQMIEDKMLDLDYEKAVYNYLKASVKESWSDDGQDGYLHGGVLPRCPDLRGDRPQHRPGQHLLLRNGRPGRRGRNQ
ncbi:MAG: glutamate synthase central domain-containing protein [Opitutaceae bacterium]